MDGPYLIYKINSEEMKNNFSYVFKTSMDNAKIAKEMDNESGEDNPLTDQGCYFDGDLQRCKECKTLKLWVYNPLNRRAMHMVIIKVKSDMLHYLGSYSVRGCAV